MKKKMGILFAAILVSSSITAFAGTTYSVYDLTVGRFNGSAYTGYQDKAVTGSAAGLVSEFVGGNYTLDVRQVGANGNTGDWKRNVGDSQQSSIDGDAGQTAGSSVRLQFSNSLTTIQNIQTNGTWKSN